jgi:thioredoxin 1
MDAIVEGLAGDYGGEVGFYRIDVEESKNVSHQMGVRRLPAIYLFKNGEISDHLSGMVPARTLQRQIDQILD